MGPPRLPPNWCLRYSPFSTGWSRLLGLRQRVQALVAEVLEDRALELVGAALGDDLEGAAVGAARVGAEALGLEVELADRVEREVLHQAADRVVVVVAAVDQVVDVAAAAARDLRGELRRLGRVGVEAEADARHQRRQVAELPAVQRQVLDLGGGDDLAHAGVLDVDQRRLGRDRDLLGLAATAILNSAVVVRRR